MLVLAVVSSAGPVWIRKAAYVCTLNPSYMLVLLMLELATNAEFLLISLESRIMCRVFYPGWIAAMVFSTK